jgi:hypothetical protein
MNAVTPADISLAVVNWNTRDALKRCLTSLINHQDDLKVQILVADNDSQDGSADMVAESFPEITLLRLKENLGFSGGHNALLPFSTGRIHVLVNSDIELQPGCLAIINQRFAQQPNIGILGPQLRWEDGRIQKSCRHFPTVARLLVDATMVNRVFTRLDPYRMLQFSHETPCAVDQIMGAFFAIRRKLIDQIGFLDQRFFMYFEEVDYCLRCVQAGHSVWFEPHAVVIHTGGASADQVRELTLERLFRSLYLYFLKHGQPHPKLWVRLIGVLNACSHALAAPVKKQSPRQAFLGYLRATFKATKEPKIDSLGSSGNRQLTHREKTNN